MSPVSNTFDADAFMTATIDEPMSTNLAGVPEGEYVAMVGDFDSTAFKTISTTNRNTGEQVDRPVLEIPFLIQDEALKAKLGREQISHRETYWLDMTPDGRLDTSQDKNVRLGQLRNCLGQNAPGVPWSPSMLRNMGPVKIIIKTTSDKRDPEKKYTNISRYAKIA
jgi:hypothetical protein